MNRSPQHLISILESKGYLLKRITGSHHIFYHAELKKTIVVPVHGKRDIPIGTFSNIIRQAGVSNKDI